MKFHSVCVFCGASSSVDKKYLDLAHNLGQMIAANKMHLVYGGGNSGLMGAVSSSAHQAGARVTGVFPRFLEKIEPLSYQLDNTIFVEKMSERKDIMCSLSDSYIILPGGLGTLDELFEVITLFVLGEHEKPIIIVNYNNYWDKMIEFIDHIIDTKFASSKIKGSYKVVPDIESAIKMLVDYHEETYIKRAKQAKNIPASSEL